VPGEAGEKGQPMNDPRRIMRLAVLALAICSASLAAPTLEKTIIITGTLNITVVKKYLRDGWTIKHQSVSGAGHKTVLVFVLSPPPSKS